jgi:hypothetical protein
MGPVFTKPPAVMGRCWLSNSAFCGPALAIPPLDSSCFPSWIARAAGAEPDKMSEQIAKATKNPDLRGKV